MHPRSRQAVVIKSLGWLKAAFLTLVAGCASLSGCGPRKADVDFQKRIRVEGFQLLKGARKADMRVSVAQLFGPGGIGICVTRPLPSIGVLRNASEPTFDAAIEELVEYDRNHPSDDLSAEYHRIYRVSEDAVLEMAQVSYDSAIVDISGEGCRRLQDLVGISGSDQYPTLAISLTNK
jgi:hypothetical protein